MLTVGLGIEHRNIFRGFVFHCAMDNCEKTPIKIYGNDPLSSRVAAFQKKADEHAHKQKQNPFSCTGNVSGIVHQRWDKSNPEYGKPPEGSKTEKRGQAAGVHIGNEVRFLCEMIHQYGIPNGDDTVSITFGELFQFARYAYESRPGLTLDHLLFNKHLSFGWECTVLWSIPVE
ncbi:hypothetical protein NPIL_604491 [Nephila pilipes]|uniref:Costars domain-containing protein n=1 Tax=Nephila pilipes TaxID=299642 RepID=A0A8X6NTT1_NEPPI|nr:hypothetical protein NPIL_672421 [Nephila pilipes]GFT31132.1 hypothetical protein NPIL_582701 [Nephila pilipes]GFU13192.1 hypothetical protein NPIL_219891 [Nephila pilipes]GFU54850.1 hypothetical protein NPIL_604491 [Nephila pilipes]